MPVLAARPGAGDGRVHAHVAETVEDEARGGRGVRRATRWRPAGPGRDRVTAAVLCRKRSQFEPLRRALRDAGLPVEVVGLGGLLSAPEVVDLVALLQAAHDPSRGDALMRLLTGARTRLGAADLHALAAWSGELAARHGGGAVRGRARRTADAPSTARRGRRGRRRRRAQHRGRARRDHELPADGWTSRGGRTLSAVGRARLADLADCCGRCGRTPTCRVPELVGEAERLLGLDIEVAARPRTLAGPGARAAGRVPGRRRGVRPRPPTTRTSAAFLAWLEAADTRENGLDMPVSEPDPDAVQLITVHAAKGLEWDVVAVAGLVDGGLPGDARPRARTDRRTRRG